MSTTPKIALVIDDEFAIRKLLKTALEPNQYKVIEAGTGEEGLVAAATHRPDIIILDLGLPDHGGHFIIEKLRQWYDRPILILSVRNDEESIVKALDLGADDYLTKPFGLGELLARMRAAHRKTLLDAEPVMRCKDLEIDLSSGTVRKNGKELHLTATEFSLLSLLAKNSGRVLTHSQILKSIWGPNSSEHVQYVRVYVGHLRQKLEQDPTKPEYIINVPGIGYRFVA